MFCNRTPMTSRKIKCTIIYARKDLVYVISRHFPLPGDTDVPCRLVSETFRSRSPESVRFDQLAPFAETFVGDKSSLTKS